MSTNEQVKEAALRKLERPCVVCEQPSARVLIVGIRAEPQNKYQVTGYCNQQN
jgi:hypothetical protein